MEVLYKLQDIAFHQKLWILAEQFHCQGWSDWQSPVCCQQTDDLKGHGAVLGTILLDLVAFPGSCIQCLS